MAGRTNVYQNKMRLRWGHHIRQWLTGDIRIADYCREHKLCQRSFYKWKDILGEELLAELDDEQRRDAAIAAVHVPGRSQSKLFKKAVSTSNKSQFVELKVQPERPASACIRVELPGGIKMEFPPDVAPEHVGSILAACSGERRC